MDSLAGSTRSLGSALRNSFDVKNTTGMFLKINWVKRRRPLCVSEHEQPAIKLKVFDVDKTWLMPAPSDVTPQNQNLPAMLLNAERRAVTASSQDALGNTCMYSMYVHCIPLGPWDFQGFCKPWPSILPSGNITGLGVEVQHSCSWEISQSSGDVFPNVFLTSAVYECPTNIWDMYEIWAILKVSIHIYSLSVGVLVAAKVKISKAAIKGWKNQGCQKVTNGPKWWRQVCMRRSADSRGKLPTVPQTKAARTRGLRGKKRDLQWSLAARCSSWSSYTIIHRFQSVHHLTKANHSKKYFLLGSYR